MGKKNLSGEQTWCIKIDQIFKLLSVSKAKKTSQSQNSYGQENIQIFHGRRSSPILERKTTIIRQCTIEMSKS